MGEARGGDQVTGLPKNIVIGAAEVRDAMKEPINSLLNAVRQVVEEHRRSWWQIL